MRNKNSKQKTFFKLLYFYALMQVFLLLSGAIASARQYETIQD